MIQNTYQSVTFLIAISVDTKGIVVILSVITKKLYKPDSLILNTARTCTISSLLVLAITVRIRSLSDTLNWFPSSTEQVTIVGDLLVTLNDKLNTGGSASTDERSWKEGPLPSIIGSSKNIK